MDNAVFNLEAKLIEQDYVQTYLFVISHRKSYYLLLAAILSGFVFLLILYPAKNFFGYVPFALALAASVFFVYFYPLGRIRKSYRRNKGGQAPIRWSVSREAFELAAGAASEKRPWSQFDRYYEGKNHFFFKLRARGGQFKILPKRAFGDAEALEAFRHFLSGISAKRRFAR